MPFIAIFLLVLSLLVAGIGIRSSFSQPQKSKDITSDQIMTSSRSTLNDMLKQIEQKDAPEQKMGAMCYDMVMGPEYIDFVCPRDGEKTVYDRKNYDSYSVVEDAVEMKRFVKHINSTTDLADLQLDTTKLCIACYPNLNTDQRFVSLITTYPDGKEYVYDNVSLEDLRILNGFFESNLYYKTYFDEEIALKGKLEKIKTLLGLKE